MEEPIIRAEGISRRFGGFVALREVSLSFRSGELASIIGPNGAGKSTLFNILSGSLAPTDGRILFEGNDVTGLPQHRFVHAGISKSFQITNVFPQLSVHENVRVAAQAMVAGKNFWSRRSRLIETDETARALLVEVGLEGVARRRAGELAHGQQRALEIAMAMACEPRLLLLDEPTAGMSPEETKDMVQLIEGLARSRTVILVEHKMKMVLGISQRVIVLHHGELLADGTPDQIRNDANVKRVYLGQGRH
ncbi:ABC transporter ATP-binding protein [Bradyrhizobium mercantei]|uniref:ABC transporter ATP-binding protein n=1 Tax=Bradyrhizobium mercantei TaxID=1904807 RepID=UPI0009779148|nr:ABC transporter ATP-binding protein [Bradyrhizobium mercantei]